MRIHTWSMTIHDFGDPWLSYSLTEHRYTPWGREIPDGLVFSTSSVEDLYKVADQWIDLVAAAALKPDVTAQAPLPGLTVCRGRYAHTPQPRQDR